jgi:hypothetical protein
MTHIVGYAGRSLTDEFEVAQGRVIDQCVGDERWLISPAV